MTFLLRDLRDHLSGSADIADAVGERIYPDAIPQESRDSTGVRRTLFPAIVLTELSGDIAYSLAGEAGRHTTQVQLDIYTDGAGGRQSANTLSELVRNRVSGYRGQFGTGCYGTGYVLRPATNIQVPTDAGEHARYRVSLDLEIHHTADRPDLT